jgi:hypothetical protein
MKTLVSMVTLGLIVSFSAPAFAGTKVPTTQAECTKAGIALGYFCEEVLQGHVKQRGVGLGRRPLANEEKGNRDGC